MSKETAKTKRVPAETANDEAEPEPEAAAAEAGGEEE